MAPLEELETAYLEARDDPAFQAELADLLHNYAGRPTPLYFAKRLTEQLGGARIWLKREDLLHTGAHKINNCLGQALLARRMGKSRIIAETGAGQHGVATATVCALLGLECVVYMGEEDMRRQRLNVFRMRLLGAKVVRVATGSRTLKDAISEAMRDWVTNVGDTYYLLGSALGSHPYPMMVRDFHKVIGEEARRQILEAEGRLPDAIFACVGGGATPSASFTRSCRMPPCSWSASRPADAATQSASMRRAFAAALPACCRAPTAIVLQDEDGQISLTHSVSAGLDYAMIGPEHAWLHDQQPRGVHGRVRCRGAGRRRAALAHRRHHSGARIGARRGRGGAARARAPRADLHGECVRPRRQGHRHLPREFQGTRSTA